MCCILGWTCLVTGERFGPTVEAWRLSLPEERVKEAQSLGRESVWSSPRKRDRAGLSLGRGFRRDHPQGRGSESISPWGEGDCQGRLSKEIVPRGEGHPQPHSERSKPGQKAALAIILPFPSGTSALPAVLTARTHAMPLPLGPPAMGHLPPQQQPHWLRGGV